MVGELKRLHQQIRQATDIRRGNRAQELHSDEVHVDLAPQGDGLHMIEVAFSHGLLPFAFPHQGLKAGGLAQRAVMVSPSLTPTTRQRSKALNINNARWHYLKASFTLAMSRGARPTPDLKAPGYAVALCEPGRVIRSRAANALPFMA